MKKDLNRLTGASMKLGLLASLACIALGCSQGNALQGEWRCGSWVSIYQDGIASLNGEKATWTAIADDAIRLEHQENGRTTIYELRSTGKSESGERTATLVLGVIGMKCVEAPSAKK